MAELTRRNQGTIAVITGGAQGVGFAIAEQLVEEGCRRIALAGRNEEKGAAAVAQLRKRDVDAIFVRTDQSVVADCLRLIDAAVEHFGAVNGLVNAAATTARGTLLEVTPEMWEEMFNTNVRGPFFLMQRLVRHLLDTKKPGSIVNILSQAAHCGQPNLTHYSASKGSLATLTKSVANAYRTHWVRCNAILPGWTDTPGEDAVQRKFHGATDGWLQRAELRQPMKQLGKPAQMAGLATYLLSPESGVMTGALIDYDQNVLGA
jgi:NAD(P)-dependent dehydrogenase (short-subunit alcohol dehydrogenase family)